MPHLLLEGIPEGLCAWPISNDKGLFGRLRFISTFKWFIYLRLEDLPPDARDPFQADSYLQGLFKRLRFIQTLRLNQMLTIYSDGQRISLLSPGRYPARRMAFRVQRFRVSGSEVSGFEHKSLFEREGFIQTCS